MKKLLVIILIIVACASEGEVNYKPQTIVLQPNNQGGYNIYSSDGGLLLEFTARNTDSLSLETLKLTYEVAEEFEGNPEDFEVPEIEKRTIQIAGMSLTDR